MKIAIDIDETVCSHAMNWLFWLEEKTKAGKINSILKEQHPEYNFTKYYKEELKALGLTGEEFWEEVSYDNVEPFKGCQRAINRLGRNHQIIFVSHCKAGHLYSKIKWVKRTFSVKTYFIDTKNKGFIDCDVFIDDRNVFLNQMPKKVKCIKISTPYTQSEDFTRPVQELKDWEAIYKELKKMEKYNG